MSRKKQTSGKCAFCGKEFAKSGMTRHLKACTARQQLITEEKGKKELLFHLQVQGNWRPEYWMHLEMPGSITLQTLDQFLRDIWLECCGHRQATRIYPWEEYAALCDACGDESEYDDEGWLPVVNSPRTGECGYTGDAFDN